MADRLCHAARCVTLGRIFFDSRSFVGSNALAEKVSAILNVNFRPFEGQQHSFCCDADL
jgi:hypothetical protein